MAQSRQKREVATKPAATKKESSEDIAVLLEKISQLEDKINAKNNKNEDDTRETEHGISGDKYVKVMSINPYWLTLCTEPYGRGKIFDFQNFGDVIRIQYRDLVEILRVERKKLMEGRFVILDKDVVRAEGLDDAYKTILTKEKMEAILSGNQSDAVKLFTACSKEQQENIALMFIDRILNNHDVDYNLIERLSKIIGYNIPTRAEEIKETLMQFEDKQ